MAQHWAQRPVVEHAVGEVLVRSRSPTLTPSADQGRRLISLTLYGIE